MQYYFAYYGNLESIICERIPIEEIGEHTVVVLPSAGVMVEEEVLERVPAAAHAHHHVVAQHLRTTSFASSVSTYDEHFSLIYPYSSNVHAGR